MLDLLMLLVTTGTQAVGLAPPVTETYQKLAQITAPALTFTQAQVEQSTPSKIPFVAKILPSDMMGLVLVSTDAKLWSPLEKVSSISLKELSDFVGMLMFLPEGITFERDIQPWLADRMAIAFLPALQDREYSPLLIIPAKSQANLDTFVAKVLAQHGRKPAMRTYNGVPLYVWQAEEPAESGAEDEKTQAEQEPKVKAEVPAEETKVPEVPAEEVKEQEEEVAEEFAALSPFDLFGFNGSAAAIAKYPDYLVIASNDRAIEQLIDAQKQLQPITANLIFQRMMRHPQWQRSLITGYGDNKLMAEYVEQTLVQDLPDLSDIPGFGKDDLIKGLRNSVKEYSAFDGYAWMQPNGMRVQSLSYYTTPQPQNSQFSSAQTTQILSYIPADTYVSISSYNFKGQWQWLLGQAELQPMLGFFVNGMREFAPSFIGLDIDKDVLPWLDGEYAMVLFPSSQGFFQEFGFNFGLGFLIQTQNRTAAEKALIKLSKFASSTAGGGLTIANRRLGSQQFTSWEIADTENKAAAKSVFAYGWSDRQTLLFATGIAPMAALSTKPNKPLDQSPIFREAIADMPKPNLGYFFMNMNALVNFVYETIPADLNEAIPPRIKTALNKFSGLSFVYSANSEQVQSDLFFGLAK